MSFILIKKIKKKIKYKKFYTLFICINLSIKLFSFQLSIAERTSIQPFNTDPDLVSRYIHKELKNKIKILNHPKFELATIEIINKADYLLNERLKTVVDKERCPASGDIHDYLSLAPYWWPDDSKSDCLPWIRKDGVSNLLLYGSDMDKFAKDDFMDACNELYIAYYLTGNTVYLKKLKEFLHLWFLNPATRMNPNINHGQSVPGKKDGREFGIIEMKSLTDILDIIGLLTIDGLMEQNLKKELDQWFTQYLNWLLTSSFGKNIDKKKNNHSTWYDVQVIRIMLYLGQYNEAKSKLESIKAKRIIKQIDSNGAQAYELERTKSLFYSAFNLEAFITLAFYGNLLDIDLWNYKNSVKESGSIKDAMYFLKPYLCRLETWPYQEIGDIEESLFLIEEVFRMANAYVSEQKHDDPLFDCMPALDEFSIFFDITTLVSFLNVKEN